MNFDLYSHTVFLTLSGSQAYGMATEESDYDYRGIVIPPMNYYIGFLNKFEQITDTDKNTFVYKHFPVGLLKDDPRVLSNPQDKTPDMQLMEICKFVNLALQNNPSVLEILFSPEDCIATKNTVLNPLFYHRKKLLSKACKARFSGYAIAQLKRIKLHKRYLDNPLGKKPTRADFGLPESGIMSQDQIGAATSLLDKEVEEYMVDQTHLPEDIKIELYRDVEKMVKKVWESINNDPYPVGKEKRFEDIKEALQLNAAANQGFSENFMVVLAREKQYRAAKKEWDHYQNWLKTRNPKRAAIEKKFHFDLKYATHLVRLLRTCREILQDGELNVRRFDAQELLEIRNGAWTYEQILEFAEKEDQALSELVKECSLPKVPDVKFFDRMVHDIICEFNNFSENKLEKKRIVF